MILKQENKLLTLFSFSSLTDIVLLLLIFFLLTSSFVAQPGLRVQLPRAEAAETLDEQRVTITLTEKGDLYLNNKTVTLQSLGQHLAAALKKTTDQVVVINADRTVSLQSTVQVIDIAKTVGATRFMIATEPGETR
jgi:biopolymer transport protein ExbD